MEVTFVPQNPDGAKEELLKEMRLQECYIKFDRMLMKIFNQNREEMSKNFTISIFYKILTGQKEIYSTFSLNTCFNEEFLLIFVRGLPVSFQFVTIQDIILTKCESEMLAKYDGKELIYLLYPGLCKIFKPKEDPKLEVLTTLRSINENLKFVGDNLVELLAKINWRQDLQRENYF